MAMVYDPLVAAVALVHVGAGAAYFGSTAVGIILVDRLLVPVETVGEWKAYRKFIGPISQFDGISALVALLSGLALLAVKYPPFDPVAYASIPNTRPLLIALALFVAVMAIAGAGFRPLNEKMMKAPLAGQDGDPVPPDLREVLKKFARLAHLQAVIVVTIVVLMVLASNGGF
jgi:hypothetical protein